MGRGVTGRIIAIAGCGIAGLACATLLARDGERVIVFDRLEKPQPLGSGLILQPVGLAALDEIGAGDPLRALGAPIRRLFGRVQPSGRVVLDVRYRDLPGPKRHGVAVHRGTLFEALYEAAIAAGAQMAPGHEIVSTSDGRLAFTGGQASAKFDLVIDALGVRSPLSRATPLEPLPFGALWANLDWPENGDATPFDEQALEQRYLAARKMVGVLPIGSLKTGSKRQAAFFWSLKQADHAAWLSAGLDAWKEQVLRLWPEVLPLLAQLTAHDQLIFASYSHGDLASPVGRDVVHIGDSWHSASPQLGQGANMALLDAVALARSLAMRPTIADALAAYAAARRFHIGLYQLASWMFTPAYQSDSAFISGLRDWLLAPISRIWPAPPILAALVAGSLASPLAAIDAVGDV